MVAFSVRYACVKAWYKGCVNIVRVRLSASACPSWVSDSGHGGGGSVAFCARVCGVIWVVGPHLKIGDVEVLVGAW